MKRVVVPFLHDFGKDADYNYTIEASEALKALHNKVGKPWETLV